jgi:hypothetical protein
LRALVLVVELKLCFGQQQPELALGQRLEQVRLLEQVILLGQQLVLVYSQLLNFRCCSYSRSDSISYLG